MTTTTRLAAAQTARSAAKRAFSRATDDAMQAAIARGLRWMADIDAAIEADPAVIAARVASKAAVAELEAAEAAMRADVNVSQDDRCHAMTAGAHSMARAMVEHDPARLYDAAAATEA